MRFVLRVAAWLAGIALLALVAVFGINATDEELAPQTLEALRVPALPEPSERNAYIDSLALGAPAEAPAFATGMRQLELINKGSFESDPDWLPPVELDPAIPQCQPGKASCIEATAAYREARALIGRHTVFLARYRAMREKPEYADLVRPASPESPVPAYQPFSYGNRLALLSAGADFNAGNPQAAVRELEAELGFYRRMAAGSHTLLSKLIAWAMHDRTALFAADLARRLPPGDRPLWARLEASLPAPTAAELDIVGPLKEERARHVDWMRTRKYVRLSDSYYEMMKSFGVAEARPWWDPVTPYLYRPHQSVNLYVKRTDVLYGLADLPPESFDEALGPFVERMKALEPARLARWLVNPVGYSHYHLATGFTDYIRRSHGHAALRNLVRLQVRLRATGIRAPEQVEAALAGPLGAEFRDPFAGRPMRYERTDNSIGFDTPGKFLTGTGRELQKSGNRVALAL